MLLQKKFSLLCFMLRVLKNWFIMNFEKVPRKSPSGENCDAFHKILGTIPSQKVTKEFRGTKCLRLTMKPVSMWAEFESSLKLPVLSPLTLLITKQEMNLDSDH